MTDAPFQIHAQESLTASDGDFISKLQNAVRTAIDEAKLLQVLGKMRESKEMPLNTENLPQLIKLTGASFKFHEEEQEGVNNVCNAIPIAHRPLKTTYPQERSAQTINYRRKIPQYLGFVNN